MSQDRATTRPGDQGPRIGHYELLDTIGRGSYGEVVLGQHIPTGTQVAIKVIRWQTDPTHRKIQERELDCMKLLDHPNIVKLFEVIDTLLSRYLVLEYVSGGTLLHYLDDHGPMTEDQARGPFRQLVSAVEYCHQKGIVHRDLKLENVLFGEQRIVRLADFGLSVQARGAELQGFCGSLPYAAPELFLGRKYGPAVDVWSLGVVLYCMLTDQLPFHIEDLGNLLLLQRTVMAWQYEPPAGVSWWCWALLRRLMTPEPRERGSLAEVMSDPWLNKGQEEELRPYSEPPAEDVDPEVMQEMAALGFQCEQVRDSVNNRRFDSVMATYVMLRDAKHAGRRILVRPFRPLALGSDSSAASLASDLGVGGCGFLPGRRGSEGPACPSASPASGMAVLPPSPELESGAATPSSVPSCGPGDSPPSHGTSPSSPGGDDGGGGSGGGSDGGGGSGGGDGGGGSGGGGRSGGGDGGGGTGGGGGGDDGGGGSGGGSGGGGSDSGGTPDTTGGCCRGLARRIRNFLSATRGGGDDPGGGSGGGANGGDDGGGGGGGSGVGDGGGSGGGGGGGGGDGGGGTGGDDGGGGTGGDDGGGGSGGDDSDSGGTADTTGGCCRGLARRIGNFFLATLCFRSCRRRRRRHSRNRSRNRIRVPPL